PTRLARVGLFEALSREQLRHIVSRQVRALPQRLTAGRLRLEVDQRATEWLAATGFDPMYGARPLKRLLQKEIGDALPRLILRGEVRDGQTISVTTDAEEHGLQLSVVGEAEAEDPSERAQEPTGRSRAPGPD